MEMLRKELVEFEKEMNSLKIMKKESDNGSLDHKNELYIQLSEIKKNFESVVNYPYFSKLLKQKENQNHFHQSQMEA